MGKVARNAKYTKEYNRKTFISLLRRKPMSSANLARHMGLTRSATSVIADELLTEGVIMKEVDTSHKRGRTPIILSLKTNCAYSVGIRLHRDACTIGIVDIGGNVVSQCQINIDGTFKYCKMNQLIEEINKQIHETTIDPKHIIGIGISSPGPLDRERGRILNPPNFDMWHYTDIVLPLRDALGMPAYLENDASALAQFNLGKSEANGSEDFLLLLVDDGIGSGVISRGKLFKGAGFFTSELGHTSINFRGRKCVCGNKGCLESYAGIKNLLANSKFTTWKEIMDSYKTNKIANELLLQEIDYLTSGIVNLANLISIDTVLLAGDMLYKAEEIIPYFETQVMNRLLRRDILPIKIHSSFAGADYQLLSAANIAFERFLMM